MRTPFAARRAVLLFAFTTGLSTLGGAQTGGDATVAPGARIRLEMWNGDHHQGQVVTLGRDTLHARLESGATPSFRLGDIAKIEVLDGRQRHVMRGASIGLAVGGAIGALVGAAAYDDKDKFIVSSRSESAAFVAAVGAVPGLVIGAALGLIPHDRWRHVQLNRSAARLELRPLPAGGRGLALALSF